MLQNKSETITIDRELKIGNIIVKNGILLAPMEDVTDLPFRIICKRLGADLVYSEFISSEGIVRDARKAYEKMKISDEERPTAIQIFGHDLENMVESAKRVEDSGADFLDINYGCWVKKVVQRNAGAGMLRQPELMAEMTRAVVEAVNIPVTVKTRLGWDENSIIITKVAQWLEQAGAKALAIHCRTRSQGMKGEVAWEWINEVKKVVDFPVILNGDVLTPEDVKRAFETTECDAVMIGRGAVNYPYIFKRAKVFLETGIMPPEPTVEERLTLCLDHLHLNLEHKGLPRGLYHFRKFFAGYLKGLFNASSVRQKLVVAESYDEVRALLDDYYDYLKKEDRLEVPLHEPELYISKKDHNKNLGCC